MSTSILRTRIGVVWLGLVAATAISFALGNDHGAEGADAHTIGTSVVLAIAFIKIWWIGNDFMELREAPLVLRTIFTAWCVAVAVVCIVLFLAGQ